MIEDRDIRQRDLIPAEELQQTQAVVIGVGAIGRQVALQLSAIGVGRLKLIDFDTVGPENLAPQGFREQDIGKRKVDAVADICQSLNSEIDIKPIDGRFNTLHFANGIIMCCVDKIDVRKRIFEATEKRFDLFVDGRMSAEFMRILTAYDDKSKEFYAKELFPANEAHRGACTAKSTIYCANVAAGMMVAQFAKWLRGMRPLDCDIHLNTLTNEMVAKSCN
jgi:sulfur carrier protein ThiS adenylyltransferase